MAAGTLARRVTLDKYAKPEIERRFRLDGVPPEAFDPVEITDRYLEGGHLRLRCVHAEGRPPAYKLGHKLRPDPTDPGVVLHTSIYLTEAEHAMLEKLPGRVLRKTRLRMDLDDRAALIDVFHGPHEGLVLLEVGFGADEDSRAFEPPSWVGPETDLSGGELA